MTFEKENKNEDLLRNIKALDMFESTKQVICGAPDSNSSYFTTSGVPVFTNN